MFENYNCIGIMGGTFNPVHKGHIHMAYSAKQQVEEIEKIIFMPNNIPKYKSSQDIASAKQRIDMLCIALDKCEWATVSDMEIKRGGITYTYDTLCTIKNMNNNIKIYFIIGSDSLKSFDKWFRYRDILSMCTLLVASRDGDKDNLKYYGDRILNEVGYGEILYLNMDELDAASSDIRNRISMGDIPYDILPEGVAGYIIDNKMYI